MELKHRVKFKELLYIGAVSLQTLCDTEEARGVGVKKKKRENRRRAEKDAEE